MHHVQEAISINLQMRASDSQHSSCLYFYDICINTSQSDCKTPTGIDGTDDKTRKNTSHDFSWREILDISSFWLLGRKLKETIELCQSWEVKPYIAVTAAFSPEITSSAEACYYQQWPGSTVQSLLLHGLKVLSWKPWSLCGCCPIKLWCGCEVIDQRWFPGFPNHNFHFFFLYSTLFRCISKITEMIHWEYGIWFIEAVSFHLTNIIRPLANYPHFKFTWSSNFYALIFLAYKESENREDRCSQAVCLSAVWCSQI